MRKVLGRALMVGVAIAVASGSPVAGQPASGCATITDRELRGVCVASMQRYLRCWDVRDQTQRVQCETAAFEAGSRACNGMAPGRRGECLVASRHGQIEANAKAAENEQALQECAKYLAGKKAAGVALAPERLSRPDVCAYASELGMAGR